MKLTKTRLKQIIREELKEAGRSNDMKLNGSMEDGIKTLSYALSLLATGAPMPGETPGGEQQLIKAAANLAKELELLADGVGLQQEVAKAIREVEKYF